MKGAIEMPAERERTWRAGTMVEPLRARSGAFLDYLDRFLAGLPDARLDEIVVQAGGPDKLAVIAVDVVNGFCKSGPLASERVGEIVEPIRRLLAAAHDRGVRAFAVLRDSHAPDAPEFAQFGPHCLRGTEESALVTELGSLPFAADFADIPKNATSAWVAGAVGTADASERLDGWVERQRASGVRTYIVVGDCTDLCVYQTAMPLKLGANARNEEIDVIVPVESVDTYDLPVKTAHELGALPHDAELLHAVFLYHMALNGIRVLRAIRST